MTELLAVYLEIGAKRTFAGVVDWPGWCRSAKTPDEALEALLAYAPRYAKAVARTKLAVPQLRKVDEFEVVEHVKGNATTEFGAPGVPPAADERSLSDSELKRQSALLEACWDAFEAAWKKAAKAHAELSKGPRGGGRDLLRMWDHVLEADLAYLGGLGSREPRLPGSTSEVRMAAVHETALETLAARARGKPIADPRQTKRLWLPRYFVRRSAWHALDHAWEIEDRS